MLVEHHKNTKAHASVTAVRPPGRFGALEITNRNLVASFQEKPIGDGGRINGGFFILNKSVLDLIDSDDTVWEKAPLNQLVAEGKLAAFKHDGFWWPMDSLRDKAYLNELWSNNKAPWKTW